MTATPPVPDATEDTDVLALVEGSRLTAKQRRFCWEFLHGETAGNAQRSYMEAFENPNKNTASVGANNLLKDPNVEAYLATLRDQALSRVEQKLKPWGDLVEEAQGIVLSIMRGHLRSRLMLDAANAVLDRALGKPPQRLEHELLRDETRVMKALSALGRRREAETPLAVRSDLLTESAETHEAEQPASPPAIAPPAAPDTPEAKKGDTPQHGHIKVKYR